MTTSMRLNAFIASAWLLWATWPVNAVLGAYNVSRGRQVTLQRGFQLQALTFTLPQDGFTNLELWKSANYTTFNFWDRSDIDGDTFAQFEPGQQWGRVWGGGPPNLDGLYPQERAHHSTLTDIQWYDEVLDTMQRLPEIATQFRAWNTNHPNALAHANFHGLREVGSVAGLANYLQATKPDVLTHDDYPPFSFTGSGRTNWYSIMQTYRTTALAGFTTDSGTNSGPVPYGQFLNLYRDSYSDPIPSESYVRLQQNASLAFGYTWLSTFIYNRPVSLGLSPVTFNSDGDENPNALFGFLADTNRQTRNLGNALVRMVSTDIRMIRGRNGVFTNSLPSGLSSWSSGTANTGGYADYITSIQPTTSAGGANDTTHADVLVGYFNPLKTDNSDFTFVDGLRFMIVNGSAAGTASASAQWYRVNFDFTGSNFNSLVRLRRDTGGVELIPLTNVGGSAFAIDLNLPGGTGDLFGFWNSQTPLPSIGGPNARVLIDQDFDDAGVFVANSTLNLSGVGNSSNTAGLWRQGLSGPGGVVQAGKSYSPGQSISTVRTAFGEGQVLGFVDNARGITSDLIETSFRFSRSTATSGSSFRLGYKEDLASFNNIEACGVDINIDGTINVVDGHQPIQILAGVDGGTWHAIKMLVDPTTRTYDVYYSADASDASFELLYSDAVIPTLFSEGGSINCMGWFPQGSGGTVYFDDAYLATGILASEGVGGDFNNDNDVDGADFLTWQRHFGDSNASHAEGDADRSTAVNGDDLAVWSSQFGGTPAAERTSASVPEPTSFAILMLAAVACAAMRCGQRACVC